MVLDYSEIKRSSLKCKKIFSEYTQEATDGGEAGVMNFRFQTLDILRFVAALGVVLFHIDGSQGNWIGSLYLCVDLFFVLSGFVLEPAYPKRRNYCEMSKFIFRRFARLAPMVYSTLFFSMAYFLLIELRNFLTKGEDGANLDMSLTSILLSLLLLQIFSSQSLLFNYPMWSLSTEWIVNVFLLLPLSSKRRTANALFLLLLGLAPQIINLFSKQPEILIQLSRCLTGIIVGIILRRVFDSKNLQPSLNAFLILSSVLFLSTFIAFNSSTHVAPMVSVIPFTILVFTLASCERSMSLKCSESVSYWAGALSFGVYAWHVPLAGIVDRYAPEEFLSNAFLGTLTLTVFSCLAGFTVTKFIEMPVQSFIRKREGTELGCVGQKE